MIKRIQRLRNAGIFQNYSWNPALPDFERLTVIYGPNGSGKTSLASALWHAKTEPESRSDLGLTVESGQGQRTATATDEAFDRLYVFSEEFVESNHRLSQDEASMSAVITIGERSVAADDEVARLRASLPDLEESVSAAEQAVQLATAAIERISGDVSGRVVDDLTTLGGEYQSRSNFSRAKVKTLLQNLDPNWEELADDHYQRDKQFVISPQLPGLGSLPSFASEVPPELLLLARRTLAATPVSVLLDTLRRFPAAESWAHEGMRLHERADVCIFCGGELPLTRRAQLEAHFSSEVIELGDQIDALIRQIRELRDSLERRGLPAQVGIAPTLRDEWTQVATVFLSTVAAQSAWLTDLEERLSAKRADIVGLVDGAPLSEPPVVAGAPLDRIVSQHNRIANEHDELLAAAAARIRNHHLKSASEEFQRAIQSKSAAELDRDAANNLIELAYQRLRDLETVEGSTAPSAEFLTTEVARLLGRVELEFRPAGADRYEILRRGEPAHGLSEGERTAITLVHFLELVRRHDAGLHGRAIVVVDDPVSSLDHGIFIGVSAYLWSAIVATSSSLDQLILLTHNFELFRQWDIQHDNLPSGVRSALPYRSYELAPIYRTGVRACEIRVWPPSQVARRKSRSAYHHAFISVASVQEELVSARSSFDTRLEAQLLFPNVVRKILETFMAFKRPGQMGGLSEAMAAVGEALAESGFEGDSSALRHDLLRFANVYSHSNTPESDFLVSPEETLPAINAVFEFMSWVDAEHFKGMCDATNLNPDELVPGFSSRP